MGNVFIIVLLVYSALFFVHAFAQFPVLSTIVNASSTFLCACSVERSRSIFPSGHAVCMTDADDLHVSTRREPTSGKRIKLLPCIAEGLAAWGRARGEVTETGRGRWRAKTVTWQLSVGNAMHDSLTALLPASSPAPRRILGQGSTLQLRDRERKTCAWSELVQHIFARWPHHANINTMRECIYLKDNSVLVESGFNDLRCRGRTSHKACRADTP